MSNEDIIKKWKDGPKAAPPQAETPPANPIGDEELPDEELENVAGGGTEAYLSIGCCTTPFCPNEGDLPTLGGT